MSVNPLGGVPPNQARGLQITNGKASRLTLKKRGTFGLDQRLGRPIRKGPQRNPIKPIGAVIKPKLSPKRAMALTDAQTNVTTVRAGVGAHIPTKVW